MLRVEMKERMWTSSLHIPELKMARLILKKGVKKGTFTILYSCNNYCLQSLTFANNSTGHCSLCIETLIYNLDIEIFFGGMRSVGS